MTWLIGLLIVVAFAMSALVVVLIVEFSRLSRELRQVGEDTSLLIGALGRTKRTLQFAIPLFIAARGKLTAIYKKVRSNVKKESV